MNDLLEYMENSKVIRTATLEAMQQKAEELGDDEEVREELFELILAAYQIKGYISALDDISDYLIMTMTENAKAIN